MSTSAAPGSFAARARWLLPLVVLVLAVLATGASPAVFPQVSGSSLALDRIDALMEQQAWGLALRRVEAAQADATGEPWEALERRRLELYRRLNDVAAYAERVARLPRDASEELRQTAWEGLFEAALAAEDPDRAGAALERLAQKGEPDEVASKRERLARLWLERGRAKDALAALGPLADSDAAHELHAEILLNLGRERDAFERVAGLKSLEARLWRLLALWRLDLYAPDDAVTELSRLVRDLTDRPRLQRLAWLVRADAAARAGQLVRRVHSLEQAFRLDPTPVAALVAASPDHLWAAYLALARHLAATEDLSLGEIALARAGTEEETDGRSARALYAWHAFEAGDEEVRERAHERLAASLAGQGFGPVVRALYTGSKRFAPAEMPEGVRRVLYAEALERGDLRAAAQYARGLEAPPEEEAGAWDLRRARVLIYGGDTGAAIAILERLIAAPAQEEAFARRWVQVVFDLQALGRHTEALGLLEAAYERVDNARMRRELLYWQAESAAALGRLDQAAELYLRSAQAGEHAGSDPWGHSARFRAAEVLAGAGLRNDAEAVYRGLLAETTAPSRRLLIEQHIERLWLDAPATTKP